MNGSGTSVPNKENKLEKKRRGGGKRRLGMWHRRLEAKVEKIFEIAVIRPYQVRLFITLNLIFREWHLNNLTQKHRPKFQTKFQNTFNKHVLMFT